MTTEERTLNLRPLINLVTKPELSFYARDVYKASLCNRIIAPIESPVTSRTGLYIEQAKQQRIPVNSTVHNYIRPSNPIYAPYRSTDFCFFSIDDIKNVAVAPRLDYVLNAIEAGASIITDGLKDIETSKSPGDIIVALFLQSRGVNCEEVEYPEDVFTQNYHWYFKQHLGYYPKYAIWKS